MESKTMTIKEKLQANREAAFRELYEAAFPVVARFIANKGGDLSIAKDIFQDAMVLYFEKIVADRLSIQHSPKAYLLGIAKNLWHQHCKHHRPGLALGEIDEPSADMNTYEETTAQHKGILDYLMVAGRKCLDLLQAFYYFKTPMKEIAEEFGYRSERSATVQKYKCLEKVRSEVKNSSHAEIIA
ncbi:MAG: sigma-70 family RNA polymerase sigma factor [Saprospiraceae bacterium]